MSYNDDLNLYGFASTHNNVAMNLVVSKMRPRAGKGEQGLRNGINLIIEPIFQLLNISK